MAPRTHRLLAFGLLFLAALAAPGCSRLGVSEPDAEYRSPAATSSASVTASTTTFAVIGDFGSGDSDERNVADLVASWRPAYVITTGDNYYRSAGGDGTGKYDESVGEQYGPWLKDIRTTGSGYPTAAVNAFFPALGNHDYTDAVPAPETYMTYFRLPGSDFGSTSGNERYYDFVEGPIHFFVLNSNPEEPDGTDSTSEQARWLQAQLAASTSRWNIVYDHHPPYSSDSVHGSSTYMRWPYSQWGADVVLSGHSHTYERIERDGIVYFVNGLGGAKRYGFGAPVEGSAKRYQQDWGAQRVTVTEDALEFAFYNVDGDLVDLYRLTKQ